MLNDSPPTSEPIGPGDQVAAARDIETTQGLYIPRGSKGIVAEDRGSTLVVFFHHQTPPSNIDEQDLRRS
jgi:hypothetical protein